MMEIVEKSTLPAIVVGERDYEQLIDLAVAAQARAPESAGSLLSKLERATVVQADISDGRISVLTPIGAALIGLRVGQSIAWWARDGKRHRLQVLSVRHGAAGC